MNKILFLYNDVNNVKGISDVMFVAERFAMQSGYGNFSVTSRPKPAINFEDGSYVAIRPISKGISNLNDYDEIYIDETVETFTDTTKFNKFSVNFYNENSFKGN